MPVAAAEAELDDTADCVTVAGALAEAVASEDGDDAVDAVPEAEADVVHVASADEESVTVMGGDWEAVEVAAALCVAVSKADALGEPEALTHAVDVSDTRTLPLTELDAEIVACELAVARAVKVATLLVAVVVAASVDDTVACAEPLAVAAPVLEAQGLGVAVSVAPPVGEAVEEVEEVKVLSAEALGKTDADTVPHGEGAIDCEGVVEGVLEGERTATVGVVLTLGDRVGATAVGVCTGDAEGDPPPPVVVGGTVNDVEGSGVEESEGTGEAVAVPPSDAVGETELLAHALNEAPPREGEATSLLEGLTVGDRENVVDAEKEGVLVGQGVAVAVPATSDTEGLADEEGDAEALEVVLGLALPLPLALVMLDAVGDEDAEWEEEAEPPTPAVCEAVLERLPVLVAPSEALPLGPPRQGEGELVEDKERGALRVPLTQLERDSVREGDVEDERLTVTDTVCVSESVAAPDGVALTEGHGDSVALREGEGEALGQREGDAEDTIVTEGDGASVVVIEVLPVEEVLPLAEGDTESEGLIEGEPLLLEQALVEALPEEEPRPPEEPLGEAPTLLLPELAPVRDGERVGERVAEVDRVRVVQEDALGEAAVLLVAVPVRDTLAVPQLDSVPAHSTVGVTVVHMVRDCEGEALVVALRDPDLHAEGEALTLRETVRRGLSEGHAVDVTVSVPTLEVALCEKLDEAEALPEADTLEETHGDADAEGEPVRDEEAQPVSEKLPEVVTLTVLEKDDELLTEGVAETVPHTVAVPLRLRVVQPVADREMVPERLCVTLVVRVMVPHALGLRLRVPEVHAEKERVRVTVTVTVDERLSVTLVDMERLLV